MTKYFAALLMFFVAWPSFAADRNGYTAQYECRAGGPKCNVDIATYIAHACEQTITTSDSAATISTKINGGSRYICVLPGDYTGKGTITITASGTSSAYKVLRYYRSGDTDDDPWSQSAGNQARFVQLVMNSASYWIIHRITINGGTGSYQGLINFPEPSGASHNIISRVLTENGKSPSVHVGRTSAFNTIQNSVMRNCISEVGYNFEGFFLDGGPTDTHIVNNETYGCTKGFYMSFHLSPGTVVENNDLWVPVSLYTDCHGNFTPTNSNSPCAAAKTIIGTKNGGTAADPVLIIHNRVWGNRKTDPNVCCADIGAGTGIYIGGNGSGADPNTTGAKYTLVQNNIVMDSQDGIGGYWAGVRNNSFIGNIVYQIKDYAANNTGNGIYVGADFNSEFYLNTIIDSRVWASFAGGGTTFSSGYNNDVRCNVVISSGAASGVPGSGTEVENNAFYGTPANTTAPSSTDVVGSTASDSKNVEFCFYRKLRTGPEVACIPNVKPTTASPHRSACNPKTGQRLNIGIDDHPLF